VLVQQAPAAAAGVSRAVEERDFNVDALDAVARGGAPLEGARLHSAADSALVVYHGSPRAKALLVCKLSTVASVF
jgi:hypothetical protein